MNPSIVSSVIAQNQFELDEILDKLRGYLTTIQLDFMDGQFVPGTSLLFSLKLSPFFDYEAHLMVNDPIKWVETIPKVIPKIIVHFESLNDDASILHKIKSKGKRVFLALNPNTPSTVVDPLIDLIDGIMVMTVEPGRYGAPFLPEMLKKVEKIRAKYEDIEIEADGGMNPVTSRLAINAGVNIIASGSFLIKSSNIEKAMKELKNAVSHKEKSK